MICFLGITRIWPTCAARDSFQNIRGNLSVTDPRWALGVINWMMYTLQNTSMPIDSHFSCGKPSEFPLDVSKRFFIRNSLQFKNQYPFQQSPPSIPSHKTPSLIYIAHTTCINYAKRSITGFFIFKHNYEGVNPSLTKCRKINTQRSGKMH